MTLDGPLFYVRLLSRWFVFTQGRLEVSAQYGRAEL